MVKTKYKAGEQVQFSVGTGKVAAKVVEAGVGGDATKYVLETAAGKEVTRYERSISPSA